jgi:uncharacterized membrane protein
MAKEAGFAPIPARWHAVAMPLAVARVTWIQLFLFLHIFGAISAIGPTLTYGMWAALGERATPELRAFVLNGIKWVDSRLATPSFFAQAATGTALIFLAGFRFWHTAWLIVGVSIYAFMMVFAVAVYAPVVRRQRLLAERIAAEQESGALVEQYGEARRRAAALGISVAVLTIAILYFMIVKPALWSAG